MTTKDRVTETVEAFLADWDRHEWMQRHGEWASEAWDDDREAYRAASERLASAIDADPEDVGRLDGPDLEEIQEAFAALQAAATSLEGQVRPGEGDFIAEGTIDPDALEDRATEPEVAAASWQGWDCREGWRAYRVGDALALNWYRLAWGHRHARDLWVIVDLEYFQNDED